MKFTKLLIILLFVCPLILSAVTYPIINYQTSEGLPQNHINALIQGKPGHILIGTQSGIGKFDGNNFSILTKENGLPHNFITDFEIDDHHNLWIATQGGLLRINQKYDTFTNYLPANTILAVTTDKNADLLWIITEKDIFYLKEDTVHKYEKIRGHTKKTDPVKDVAVNRTGITYFYTDRQIIEVDNGRIRTINPAGNNEINFLKPIDGKIVVGTVNGLFLLDNQRLVEYIKLPSRQRNVTAMAVDDNRNLWLGTTRGVILYNIQENKSLTITKENGLVNDHVTNILIDKEKNAFIGTQWGISQLSVNFFKMYDVKDGLPHEFVWCFEEDNGTILIGTDSGIAGLKNGHIYPLPINKHIKKNSVRAVIKMKQNDFLIGTRDNGIYEWDGQNRFERVHETAHVLCAVKSSLDNRAWFGTDDGILKYDEQQFKHFRTGLRDHNVWCLAFLDRNTLLVGTGKGIQVFRKERFIPSPLEEIIGEEIINDIKVLSDSRIAIATELKGLYFYNENEGDVSRLDTSNGLLHNDVWSVIEDNNGSIWFNTSVSLDRYTDGAISHFNKKTGLFGHEGNIHAVFKDSLGKIYFGIAPGLVEIVPREKNNKIPTPILYIKKFIVNGKTVTPGNRIVLPHNSNNIEFRYIAVSTRKENPLKYKTRLSPLDRCWSESTDNTHIKYLNLPPDHYIFKVKANNGGGETHWFTSENEIRFTIKKPYWFTWWFLGVSGLLFLMLVFIIVKSRLKSLESQKKQLEQVVKQRTEEIVQKNKELAHLSLTDPLTDLKNRRYLEEKIKEEINILERHIFDDSRTPPQNPEKKRPDLAVFILDIDRFKKVNDMYGHKAGDVVLIDIARLLIDTLRNSDTIVRWGGEEFLIITWQKTIENSYKLAERLRQKMAQYPFKIDDNITINKTVSVGFAHFPFIPRDITTVTWSQVVSTADSALYIAKNNGRNLTVGLKAGEKTLDIDFKEILSDIEMGVEKKYIELVSSKKKLKLPGLKT